MSYFDPRDSSSLTRRGFRGDELDAGERKLVRDTTVAALLVTAACVAIVATIAFTVPSDDVLAVNVSVE